MQTKSASTFWKKYFNWLLILLLLLFVFRPSDRSHLYIAIWQFCFVAVFLSSIFGCEHAKITKTIGCILAIPSLLCNWIAHFYKIEAFEFIYLLFTFLFVFLCVASIIWKVILNAKVTIETLRGVICVYFMIAFAFAYLYVLIEYCNPGSFYFLEGIIKLPISNILVHTRVLSEMIFFSFVTLLTIGFGNIHALANGAQTAVIIEGTIGQFYIAILVSRIIAVYSYYSQKKGKEPAVFSSEND